jgi:hypothetical protein
MVLPFFFPAVLILKLRASGRGEEASGEISFALRVVEIRLNGAESGKISLGCQANLPEGGIGDSSSPKRSAFSKA